MGDMRPANNSRSKRSLFGPRFYIGDIQTDKISVINIDIPSKRCYVRVQAFAKVGKEMKPVREATMTLIGKERAEQEQYYGYTRGTTNKDGVACIPAWCDSDVVLQSSLAAVIHLEPDSAILETLPSGIEASIIGKDGPSSSFTFTTKVSSQSGPIFTNDEMNKCLDPDDNLRAFKFYTEKIQRQRCYIRAQAFMVNGSNVKFDPSIKVVLFDGEPLSNYGWPISRRTDDYGIACIPVWCGFEVTLLAKKDAVQLIPDHTILSKLAPELDASMTLNVFSFTTKVASQLGPIFSEPEMCSSADDHLIAFKFYRRVRRIKFSEFDDFGSRPPGHPLSWYKSDAAISDKEVTKCFVKVNIVSYPRMPLPMVSVESFTPDHKTMYGLSTKRPTLHNKLIIRTIRRVSGDVTVMNMSSSSACVEYRCGQKDRQTLILVKLLTRIKRCFYGWQEQPVWLRIIETWGFEYDFPSKSPLFAPVDISDSTVGFYSGPGKVAKERCQAGTDDISKPISKRNPLFTARACVFE